MYEAQILLYQIKTAIQLTRDAGKISEIRIEVFN